MATSSNYTSLAYIAEVTKGTTPATPTFQLLPTTGGGPVANRTTAVSEVIRSDRQTDDLITVDSNITGDLNFELSYDPYKPFLIAVLQNNTTTAVTGDTGLTVTSGAGTTLAATGVHTNIDIGDVFEVTSATDTDNDGVYTCIDNTTPNEITVSPDMATGSAVDYAITNFDRIVNGSDTPKSYTIRKKVTEGGSDYYWYYRGCSINSMSLNFATGSILNGSINILGLTEETRTTVLTGETADTAIPAYSIMNATSSIGEIYLEGVTLGTCTFSSLDLTIDNQMSEAKSIGTEGACDTAAFSLNVSGSVQVYFKDLSLYNKFKNADSFGVTITMSDGDAQVIGINMPVCKFETLDTPIDGKDTFLMQSGTFRALRDATDNYMIKFTLTDKA